MAGRSSHSFKRGPGRAALVCLAMLAFSMASAQEVQVILRNGDRLTGSVITQDVQHLTLTNALLGRFAVPLAQIDRRVAVLPVPNPAATNQSLAALAAPPPSPAATNSALARSLDDLLAAYVSNRITAEEFYRQRAKLLATADANARAVMLAATALATPAALPRQPVKITGEVQAGMDLGFATKERQLYTGRAKAVHTQDRLRNTADFNFTYGRTDGDISANRMDGTLKTDYELTQKTYLYNLGGGGYDELRKLSSYYQIGPGAGDHLLKLPNFILNVEAGGNFQQQRRTDGTETDVFYYRLAQDSKLSLFGQKLTLDEKFEYFPQWNKFSEYKLRFEANAKYWLRGNMFLNLSVINFYDTMPASGVEPNDLQIRSTIGVKF